MRVGSSGREFGQADFSDEASRPVDTEYIADPGQLPQNKYS